MGTISAGVSSDARTAGEAGQKNGAAVRRLFEVLKQLGIEARDIKTAGLSVNPRYVHPDNKEPQLVGYTATYDLTVTVRKLDDLGRVLDGLVGGGPNRQAGVTFGCSDAEQLLDDAR